MSPATVFSLPAKASLHSERIIDLISLSDGDTILVLGRLLVRFNLKEPASSRVRLYELSQSVTCAALLNPQQQPLLLLGLQDGQLMGLDVRAWESVGSIILAADVSPRAIVALQPEVYLLLGDQQVMAAEQLVLMDALHRSSIDRLRKHACVYELGRDVTVRALLPLHDERISGWPRTPMMMAAPMDSPQTAARLILAGQNPMLSILQLTPIEEALPDPVVVAADFFSNTVGGWFRDRTAPSSPTPLLSRLQRGFYTDLLALNDADRILERILPVPASHLILLFDVRHGRALLLDPRLGLFLRQIKGLRGCLLAFTALPDQQRPILAAYHPRRSYVDLVDVLASPVAILARHEISPTPQNPQLISGPAGRALLISLCPSSTEIHLQEIIP